MEEFDVIRKEDVFAPLKLSVLTLNIWGLPMKFAKDREVRVAALADYLSQCTDYDVVCLQEVWSETDFKFLRSRISQNLHYSHFFYSGVLGSGLCMFSKWPLISTFFHQWPVNGYIHKIHHGDWFGGKGVGMAQLNVNGLIINIYTTHLHAEYSVHYDEYLAHRVIQAFDTALFIHLTSGGAHASILTGDINTTPDGICCRIITSVASLTDTCKHADYGTYFCPVNTYTPVLQCNSPWKEQRIDYIFFRSNKGVKVDCISTSLPLKNGIPKHCISYSDHEAVEATMFIKPGVNDDDPGVKIKGGETLEEAVHILEDAITSINMKQKWFMFYSIAIVIFLFMSRMFLFGVESTMFALVIAIDFALFLGLIYSLGMSFVWHFIEKRSVLGAISRIRTCTLTK